MEGQVTYKQEPPFAFQFEPVEGCNLGCLCCGIQGIRSNGADGALGVHGKNSGPFKMMTVETAARCADEIARLGWNPRIEFAMHGEPTLNPVLANIIAEFRRALPKSYILVTSNGGGVIGKNYTRIIEYFRAGLNTLALDMYQHAGLEQKIREAVSNVPVGNRYEYPEDPDGNPHKRHNGKKIVFVQDILAATKGTHSAISHHAGSGGMRDWSQSAKRCAKPFREMSVRWDGNVAICCVDWEGSFKVGNVHDMPLDAIWNAPALEAARRILMKDGRALEPCHGCSERSTRVGLLPDKKGAVRLPDPTPGDYALVEEAVDGEPYTARVKPKFDFK